MVLGSADQEGSHRFFTQGLGFKVSDTVPGLATFMRCTTDHHNVLVQQAPLAHLHHTAWEVGDVDEAGRGATTMLEGHPEHVWGLGASSPSPVALAVPGEDEVRARWSASARWGEGARDRVAIGVRFGLREVAGCARVTREDGGFGAECGDPLVPQQGVP